MKNVFLVTTVVLSIFIVSCQKSNINNQHCKFVCDPPLTLDNAEKNLLSWYILDNGAAYGVDDFSNNIIYYSNGSKKTVGVSGKGPGAFMSVSMAGTTGENLVIYDLKLARLTVFDDKGEMLFSENFDKSLFMVGYGIEVLPDSDVLLLPLYNIEKKTSLVTYDLKERKITGYYRQINIDPEDNTSLVKNFFLMQPLDSENIFVIKMGSTKSEVFNLKDNIVKKYRKPLLKVKKAGISDFVHVLAVAQRDDLLLVTTKDDSKKGTYIIDKAAMNIRGFIPDYIIKSKKGKEIYVSKNGETDLCRLLEISLSKKRTVAAAVREELPYGTLVKSLKDKAKIKPWESQAVLTLVGGSVCILAGGMTHKNGKLYLIDQDSVKERDLGIKHRLLLPLWDAQCINDKIYFTSSGTSLGTGVFEYDLKTTTKVIDEKIMSFAIVNVGENIIYKEKDSGDLLLKKLHTGMELARISPLLGAYGGLDAIQVKSLEPTLFRANDSRLLAFDKALNRIYMMSTVLEGKQYFSIPGYSENNVKSSDLEKVERGKLIYYTAPSFFINVRLSDNYIYAALVSEKSIIRVFDLEGSPVKEIDAEGPIYDFNVSHDDKVYALIMSGDDDLSLIEI